MNPDCYSTDVSALKADVATVKLDFGIIKADIAEIKILVAGIRDTLNHLVQRLEDKGVI